MSAAVGQSLDRFSWRSYDVRSLLPANWQKEILDLGESATRSVFYPKVSTTREADPETGIPLLGVDGDQVREKLPWLYDMYTVLFRQFAQVCLAEPVLVASQSRYGAVLNIQRGESMRFVCHVDSNPLSGLLYVTDHPKGSGGELVVSNVPGAQTVNDVDSDCSVIYPVAGNLVFFDGRRAPHYVRPLVGHDSVRVVVAMNYYVASCPETNRPSGLDDNRIADPEIGKIKALRYEAAISHPSHGGSSHPAADLNLLAE